MNDLAYASEEILFIDDNALNVDAARQVGIMAEVGKGADGITRILQQYHLLPPPHILELKDEQLSF